jgi:hypothetical protein
VDGADFTFAISFFTVYRLKINSKKNLLRIYMAS